MTDRDNSSGKMQSVRKFPNNISIHICFSEMKRKKYKEQKVKEIVSSFCAVLNSYRGTVTMEFKAATESDVKNLKRAIEQRLSDILGFSSMRDHINLVSSRTDGCMYTVEGTYGLSMMNYNLYIPTETQFVAVSPKTPIAEVKEILSSDKRINVEVEKPVEIGTHCKEFVYQQNIADPPVESKTVQFKKLKAEKSKCVTLGDRMTNKANKFANYVSAFANHRGGHIYYGVQDDGVVTGEFVEDKEEITKKVSKAINKMVWPTECEGPKKGQHWEIFFEPVNNANGDVVPSTFVIVVYIARCAGGVFTEEPESYHVVCGEVKRIVLHEWRERMFQIETTLSQHVKRVQWSSERKEKRFYTLTGKMVHLRNNGNGEDFERFAKQPEMTSKSEDNLTILSQMSIFASRRNELEKAKKFIKEYEKLLRDGCNNEDFTVFEIVEIYMKSTKERSAEEHKRSYSLATLGIQNLESIAPGLVSVWFYRHAASLLTTLACEEKCEDRCAKIALAKTYYGKALEHVSYVSGFTEIVADVQQYIYIDIAFLCLVCSVNGTMVVTATIPEDGITCAKNCLMKVEKLILEGHALSSLRQIQYLLAKSNLLFRQSQLSTSTHQRRRPQLESSLRYSKKALNLALECKFGEMVVSCRQRIACVTEEIVRDLFRNLKLKKTQELFERQ